MVRFSQRLTWSNEENPLAQLAQELRDRGTPIVDLTDSNPTHVLESYPHDLLARVADYKYEPDCFGEEQARFAISSYYSDRQLSAPENRIALTASSSESYAVLFKLLCDPGDSILVPSPSYPLFEYLAALECVRTVPYRLAYDGSWHIDLSDLRSKIHSHTKAIVVVAPNNPTGSFLHRDQATELASIAAENGLPIISDEVFMDYPVEPARDRLRSFVEIQNLLSFSLNGLSKAAAMPQMKLGWIVLNGPERDVSQVLPRLELILDTYLSVNTPVQRALADLLKVGNELQSELRARTQSNLSLARSILGDSGAHPLFTEGGWSSIIQLPNVRTEAEWVEAFLKDSVLVQPGYFFDMPSEPFIVVSLITEPDRFQQGLHRIAELVSGA